MKVTYYGPDLGILPGSGGDCAAKLQAFFDSTKENARLVLAPGEYFLEKNLLLQELSHITVSGSGARLIAHFDPTDPYTFLGCLDIRGCRELCLEDLCLTTDTPANIAGRVVSIDRENLAMDIMLEEGFRLTGRERLFSVDSFDEGAAGPNWHVYFADDGNQKGKGYRYQVLSDRMIRMLCWPSTGVQILNLQPGERLCMRHSLYPSNQITFRDCADVLLQDITVESSPGECCAVYPRCRNFTFRRFSVKLPAASRRIYASNADGIHITGLGGKLVVEDCVFESLGDDAINVHTTGAVVTQASSDVLQCTLGDRLGQVGLPLEPNWACSGDEIAVYRGDTFVKKGTLRVTSYEEGRLCFAAATCSVRPGDLLANLAFCPDTLVQNCRFHGTRARGILFQTNRVRLFNCSFSDIAHQAIQITSDMTRWSEMCPCDQVVIENNAFFHNGLSCREKRSAGIAVGIGHEGSCYPFRKASCVHGEIRIAGNSFRELKATAIFADRVQTLMVCGNEFAHCCTETKERPEDYCNTLVLFNCDKVLLEQNRCAEEADARVLRR